MAEIIEFPRGDGVHHYFYIPASIWSAGGRLFFAAKSNPDDDNTDSAAVINQNWGDDAVTSVTVDGIAYKKYDCYFPPSATNNIHSEGSSVLDFQAEFQWVPDGGDPLTFPPTDDKLDAKVYFDIKRKTSV